MIIIYAEPPYKRKICQYRKKDADASLDRIVLKSVRIQ